MTSLAYDREDEGVCPQTEAQLFARIDHALEQVRRGEYMDADAMDVEMEELLNSHVA